MNSKNMRQYGMMAGVLSLTFVVAAYSWNNVQNISPARAQQINKPPVLPTRPRNANSPNPVLREWYRRERAMGSAGIAPYTKGKPIVAEVFNDSTYIAVFAGPHYLTDGSSVVLERITYISDASNTKTGRFSLARVYRVMPSHMVDIDNPEKLLRLQTQNMEKMSDDPITLEHADFDDFGLLEKLSRWRNVYYAPNAPRGLPSYEVVTPDLAEQRFYADPDNVSIGLTSKTFTRDANGNSTLSVESYHAAGPNGQAYLSARITFDKNGNPQTENYPNPALTPSQHQNGGR